ncbi:helix-turn-helix domain-containing protein [Streptomyces sp. AV19]|uniref:helix-turn-helix domain-containing protein n=1 Tax=Streptomyces sp. AV19 TaxID=2793068 RepID=UPI0018FF03EB|nr:helix-turn-helix domain-containing protein [Streptomyces sp. AV19]MBH1933633.1 helix-turn-helix domain-containing protein [Streptomyces sp. AV19]MDG4535861.1 helix-turn-helix domain-containing protein [Streptomyces sp. AV19]
MSAGSVAVAVIDDDVPFWDLYELGVVCTVFGIPHPDLADPWYDLRLCAASPSPGAPPPAAAGFTMRTPYGLEGLEGADTVIIPSVPEACVDGERELPDELLRALRRAADRGARMVSLCAGAFALAAAGVLDGRRATAHWMHTEALARRHPEVEVDDSVLYVDDGNVLTSAGVTAGLDLCLHLVRRDLGAHVANQLARRLVVPAHRPGGQAQFVEVSVPESGDDGLAPVLQWATERLDEPLTVDDLAARAGMSPRTFYRRLHAATGSTPLQWLLAQRLSRAQSLLEATALPVERVGELSGLGTAANLRRHFTLHFGVTPTDYRRAFPGRAVAGPDRSQRTRRGEHPRPRGH